MADAKITELTELAASNATDLLVIVDDPLGTPITKKITKANLLLPETAASEDLGSSTKRWSLVYANQFNAPSGGLFRFAGKSQIEDTGTDGWILIKPNSGSAMKISLGDTATTAVMIKRNGTTVEARKGDDSAYGEFAADKYYYGDKANNVFDGFGAGTPEGAVTAAIGSTFRRTDGGANTTFYVKESGTGNTGWVAK